ncbi:TonB family C-terminal domain-containing protein [Chryseobacterium vrystaatense]|uniref:TonB family C-terminal domain-containing protein n=2 Tax=Chryseobacterium vrystaatense TaxID=307480 RepID=A0A1M4TNK2_9FLAO|nr:TonB family C-terminal domain-containing protein [Chryseobacterium vrystaatense]
MGMTMIRVLSLFVFLLFVKLSGQENGKDSLNRAMPGGMGAFRADVEKQIDLSDFIWNEPFNLVVKFQISKEGKMENIKLVQSSGNAEFDERILYGVKRLRKKKWAPAKRNGKPVESYYSIPMTFHPPQ